MVQSNIHAISVSNREEKQNGKKYWQKVFRIYPKGVTYRFLKVVVGFSGILCELWPEVLTTFVPDYFFEEICIVNCHRN